MICLNILMKNFWPNLLVSCSLTTWSHNHPITGKSFVWQSLLSYPDVDGLFEDPILICEDDISNSSKELHFSFHSAKAWLWPYLLTVCICGCCHCSPCSLLLLPLCALQVMCPRQQSCPALRVTNKERRRNQIRKQITGGKEVNKQPWKTTCTLPLSLSSVLSTF